MAQRGQAIALIFVTLLLAACARSAKTCVVCHREECTGFAFRVTLQNGKQIEICCPRCGMEYVKDTNQKVRALWASDNASGKWIDATKAVYVSGSDVSHCATAEARRDSYGCCYYKGYDRCQPSLIAFATREAALALQKEHGGDIETFEQMASGGKKAALK